MLRSITLFLCIACCSNQIYSQTDILDSRVGLNIQVSSLKKVFENIEAKNNIVVSYSSSIVDVSIEKAIDTTSYICSDLFSYLLQDQAVRAISRGRKILIIPDPSKNISFSKLNPEIITLLMGM